MVGKKKKLRLVLFLLGVEVMVSHRNEACNEGVARKQKTPVRRSLPR
jgi:hypothetical protein